MNSVLLLRVSVHERISAAAEDFLLPLEKAGAAVQVSLLRPLLTERLAAAAEEVVALFDKTVSHYETKIRRSEKEVCRQREALASLLRTGPKPQRPV
ncbi:uncharacterized protein LOC128769228 isoform X2 [Synchiropus splendidus]|uniref:uncharacterized protein LOC128769228 isoform X2 n=1 Tax=Synchiropus splendidus TaxID=270530 RepID=UPI00237DD081|nr:uncharacterized protein LOC128769228 isoform X2 [Synchiropus splendidus]